MKVFAYVRVSTQEQNEDRQLLALAPFDIPAQNLYMDKQSGKDFKRPAYRCMVRRLRPGDMLYLKSIDRLGRNYAEIIEQWRILTKDKRVDIKVLDMPLLDTTYCKDLLGTFISDLTLQIMSFFAQLERDTLRQRQAEGIAAARSRGILFGRTPAQMPEDFETLYRRWRVGELTTREITALCGISRRTLYEKTESWRKQDKLKFLQAIGTG
ncbi:MAG: recombinase family protein [Oscillospiraceae bacterium]|jgi:DNA invertase Pin-like site-specific DNA recombinase|nr:recombinase family protein [Oscillospiraceae bacterium]